MIDEYRDVESLNTYADEVASGDGRGRRASDSVMSRDHARTPMQWDASPNAGSRPAPVARGEPNHDLVNAGPRVGDPDSVFEYYRALIALRHERPVVAHAATSAGGSSHPAIFAFEREQGPTGCSSW